MKKQISRAIDYIKSVSITEPTDFRVEEMEGKRIVLSYKDKSEYMWSERIYKELRENSLGSITSMKSFNPPIDTSLI